MTWINRKPIKGFNATQPRSLHRAEIGKMKSKKLKKKSILVFTYKCLFITCYNYFNAWAWFYISPLPQKLFFVIVKKSNFIHFWNKRCKMKYRIRECIVGNLFKLFLDKAKLSHPVYLYEHFHHFPTIINNNKSI